MNNDDLEKLAKYMDQEIDFFRQLQKYENLKVDVIIKQDVDELKGLSRMEEKLLERIEEVEKERENVVCSLFDKYEINSKKILSNLLRQLPDGENEYREQLSKKKEELVHCIRNLKSLNSMNNKLLQDSITFFNYTLNSIKNNNTITYNNRGDMPGENKNSWLVNRHA